MLQYFVSLTHVRSCAAGANLVQMKSGILNFTAAGKVPPAECILLYLVAAADPDDSISRRGEELLKKRFKTLIKLILGHLCHKPIYLLDTEHEMLLSNMVQITIGKEHVSLSRRRNGTFNRRQQADLSIQIWKM